MQTTSTGPGRTLRDALTDHRFQRHLFVLTVLIPMIATFAVFWIYPLVDGFWGSLHRWTAFDPSREFIGLKNYVDLFGDPTFRAAVVNSFEYMLYYLPSAILLSLLLALGINASGQVRALFRTVYFLPVVTSVVATSLIFNYLYQPRFGLINQLLALVGLPEQGFLRSPAQALPSIAAYAVWKNLGFNMVLFLAGLSAIPQMYYDAARVDGANPLQRFFFITLPLLRPTVVFIFITGMIETLQVFRPIFVMTATTGNDMAGGPLNSTMVIALYQWQTAFTIGNLGYGAAMGIMLFLIVMVITVTQALVLRSRWSVD